jgi:Ca-activated chloride channel family protein
VITELYYWFNGVRYKGSVREKKEAQAAYDKNIRKYIDPALLQEIGDNVFKLNIAPIEPGTDVRFEITYTEILPYVLGTTTYTHLLRTMKVSAMPLKRMSLRIEAATQGRFTHAVAPAFGNSPSNSITWINDKFIRVTFGDENFTGARDYTLDLRSSRDGIDLGTLTYVPTPDDSMGVEPFFATWVAPPDSNTSALPRSIVFVADVSSSMEGTRIDQLRIALEAFLDNLQPHDKFNIITFSTGVAGYAADLIPATDVNIAGARAFVRDLIALGLTNISEALHLSLKQSYDPQTARALIFLTDGQPSWGETNENVILDSVRRWNTADARVYPIAVGTDLSIRLMQNIASQTGGFVTSIEKDDSIAVTVRTHIRRISMPEMTNLALSYGGLEILDVYPATIPDLLVGQRVMQFGRYRNGGERQVTLTGMVSGAQFSFAQTVFFGDPETQNKAVARLWAQAKITALLDLIATVGERQELVDAVIDLSIRFGILTRYTALYADPNDPATGVEDDRPIEALWASIAPNPATPDARITIHIPAALASQHITAFIVDVRGTVVTQLADGQLGAGQHSFRLGDHLTTGLAHGTYWLVVRCDSQQFIQPIIITE